MRDALRDLLLDNLASGVESLVEVLLLLLDLVPQRQVLLLDAFNEDVGELAHIVKFALNTSQLGFKF